MYPGRPTSSCSCFDRAARQAGHHRYAGTEGGLLASFVFHCGIRFRRNVTLNKRRAAAIFRFLTPEISLTIIYPDYKSVQESSWVYIMHRALFQLVYSLIF